MDKNRYFLVFLIFQLYGFLGYAQTSKQYLLYFDQKDYEEYLPKLKKSKQEITIGDSLNCPIKKLYLSILSKNNIQIIGQSKWLNAVAITIDTNQKIENIKNLPFIKNFEYLSERKNSENENAFCENSGNKLLENNQNSKTQINMENGFYLHDNGFKGKGITIAILDGGFSGADTINAFKNLRLQNRINYAYDFVDEDTNPFKGSEHGTNCFSIMAAQKPSNLMGTAPDANYILIRTEDTKSEQKIEEFNLVRGLELADSLGAKVINISLGYTKFDHNIGSYNWQSLTQNNSISQKGVELAAKKGLLVVVSAGNDGDEKWEYISFPANAKGSLTVGAVDSNGKSSFFSSKGYAELKDIKPDVVALGENVFMINGDDELYNGNGTSFASPIIAGLSACLWQAFPKLSASEIIEVIQKSSNQFLEPDSERGYGLPNFKIAFFLASRLVFKSPLPTDWTIAPPRFENDLFLWLPDAKKNGTLKIYNSIGKAFYGLELEKPKQVVYDLSNALPSPGFYISSIITKNGIQHQKLIKR